MDNPLALVKSKINQLKKTNILKNRAVILDAMGEVIKDAPPCPFLMMSKCVASCPFFMEFKAVDNKTGRESPYRRCAFVETPLLLIELIQEVRKLREESIKDESISKKQKS